MSSFDDRIREEINVAAYFMAQKCFPRDTLCNMLAERQLFLENEFQNVPIDHIKQRAAQIFHSGCEYDIICWLIAEKDIVLEKKGFKVSPYPYFEDEEK